MRRLLASLLAVGALSACATPAPTLNAEGLIADLRTLSADHMQGRRTGQDGGRLALAYVVGRFQTLDLDTPASGRTQGFDFTSRGGAALHGTNVVGVIHGTRVPDRWIVITAHYDHEGVSPAGEIYNGADDNASGVATMLEIARQLKLAPPEHSVLIVALDAEERGLHGARAFVANPPVPLTSMSMNLNFDMTAREDDGHLWVVGTHQNPALRPILETVQPSGPVSLAFGKDTPADLGENNWVNASDHAAFHARGVPFIYMGADYHADYHKPTDDFERITPAVFLAASELAVRSFRALDRALDR